MNQERIFIVKIPNCPDTIKPEHIKAILASIECNVEEAIQIPLEIGDLVVKTGRYFRLVSNCIEQ